MKAITKASGLDIALLMLTAIMWASAFIAIKIAVPEVGPLWLACIRVAIGAIVLAPYAIYRGIILPSSPRMWGLVTVMATLNVVIPFFLISWAELTLDAGVTSLLMGVGPFLALVGNHFFTDDDKISSRKALGVALGFSGVLIIVGWDALNQLGGRTILAQLAAIGGCCCYVMAGILIRRIDIPPTRLAFLALAIGTIILVPLSTIISGAPNMAMSKNTLFALMYLGFFPTGLAYILRFYLIQKVGYTTFSISVNMIPVFGILLGILILGEPLRWQVLFALVLVLAGLFVMRSSATPTPTSATSPNSKA